MGTNRMAVVRSTGCGPPRLRPPLRVAVLNLLLVALTVRHDPHGDAVICGPLEHCELGGITGNDRYQLQGRGSRSDDAYPASCKRDLPLRPHRCQHHFSREVRQPRQVRNLRRREAACRHDDEPCADLTSGVCREYPPIVILCIDNPLAEYD